MLVHLLRIDDLTDSELVPLLQQGAAYFAQPHVPLEHQILKGRSLFSVFFEDSTRTRASFELAVQRLGGQVVTMYAQGSSLSKGETMLDALQTLHAMRPDGMVIRLSETGLLGTLAAEATCPIFCAGEGALHHPTQALLDALTIAMVTERIKSPTPQLFEGLTVAICGDILHSRVAQSNVALLLRLGAVVRIVAPAALQPRTPYAHCVHYTDLAEGIAGAHVVMMLRTQRERMGEEMATIQPPFTLTHTVLKAAHPEVRVLHPGPMNRGEEIDSAVADDPRYSCILQQVSLGVAVRMAVLARSFNR